MFVIHEVQLQKVCGSDNWMTPREGKNMKKASCGGCDACGRRASGPQRTGPDTLPGRALQAQHPCPASQGRFQQDLGPRPQSTPIGGQFNAFCSLWQLWVARGKTTFLFPSGPPT